MAAITRDMTQGKPIKLILRFALPLMGGYIFQQLYTMVDSIVVGRFVGVGALASLGAADFYSWLVLSIVLGFSQGFGILFAQRFGARDHEGLRKSIAMSILLSVVLGLVVSTLGLLLIRPLLRALNTPADIIDGAILYLDIYVGGMLVFFAYNLTSGILRALGNSRTPLVAMILASVINIVLDILLVTVIPLGILGVAVATVTAEAVSFLYCLLALRKIQEIHLRRSDFTLHFPTLRELLRLGAPVGLRNAIIALGGVAIQSVINAFGTIYVAGISLPKKLYGMMELIGTAVDGAVATFVGQNYGARRLDRVALGVRDARRFLLVCAVCVMALLALIGRPLFGLLVTGEAAEVAAVVDVAYKQMLAMISLLPMLYMLLMYRSALQGLGNALQPMISGFVELVCRVVAVFTLPRFFGEWGLFFSESICFPFAALQLYIAYRVVYRKRSEELSRGEDLAAMEQG